MPMKIISEISGSLPGLFYTKLFDEGIRQDSEDNNYAYTSNTSLFLFFATLDTSLLFHGSLTL